jgi:NAD(P)-dependent dehydrogenase (short-subunit alcohol dehydrogenase family)
VGLELFSLAGRVALVTGGNGGLGLAMALGLRDAGARVSVTGRDPDKNRSAADQLGDDAVHPLDVRDEAAVEELVAAVAERHGGLDVLVNNAGGVWGFGALDMDRADWDATVDTDLTGAYLCAKHAARGMLARGRGGTIINIASVYGAIGTPAVPHYAAAKAGLIGLTRSLGVELAPHGIRVNALLPGVYETEAAQGNFSDERRAEVTRRTPAGRWGRPEELVGPVVFLASDASSYVTGVELPVDGGFLISPR